MNRVYYELRHQYVIGDYSDLQDPEKTHGKIKVPFDHFESLEGFGVRFTVAHATGRTGAE